MHVNNSFAILQGLRVDPLGISTPSFVSLKPLESTPGTRATSEPWKGDLRKLQFSTWVMIGLGSEAPVGRRGLCPVTQRLLPSTLLMNACPLQDHCQASASPVPPFCSGSSHWLPCLSWWPRACKYFLV